MRLAFLVFFAFLQSFVSFAQLKGIVSGSNGEGLPYVSIGIENTSIGTQTDEHGYFFLDIPSGSNRLVISAIGYKSRRLNIDGSQKELNITLTENSLGLNEVVVTGTQYETFVKASPVKVEVITSDFLKRNFSPTNLVEGISMINGVQEVVACGVCYTNSISINGLPGPYTAVLMDGTPIYGNLAATYGLNGIPTSIIDRFEVIKGPSSTLYGSEAVAGVINIITKDPEDHPLLSVDLMATSHLESFGNLAFSPRTEKSKGYIGLNYAYINDFDDNNQDGFGDMASLDRISLFSKWNIHRKSGKKLTIAGKLYYEDRRNGVQEFLEDRNYRNLRGSDEVYGESIYTQRAEMFGLYEITGGLNLDYSFSHHLQDSYYGADLYRAQQTIFYTNLRWQKSFDDHILLGGLTLRQQNYDDNTLATRSPDGENLPDNAFNPGLFIQDEWKMSEKITVLGGIRADYHEEHDLEWSPRLSIKYSPFRYTTFRINSGTGFKLVNLFTEDHAFVSGQRQVIIEEKLAPEESVNITFNTNHVYTIGESQGMLDIDLYYTHFSNKIIPDYDTPGQIIYRNSNGSAVTRGIAATITQQWMGGLGITAGGTWQRVFEVVDTAKIPVEFSPQWSGVLTVNYYLPKNRLTLAYTASLTGPIQLPRVFDLDNSGNPLTDSRPTLSQPFSLHNFQVMKDFENSISVYLGVQNIFNYQQGISPLVGYDDPNYSVGFSPYFDTSYAYSPLHGREYYLGIRWSPAK